MTPEEHAALCTVSFPQAGAGAFIRFRTVDLTYLAKTFQADGEPWFRTLCRRIRTPDPKAITDALAVGLKGVPDDAALDWSDLPFPLTAASEPILTAIGRALYGRQFVDEAAAQARAPAAGNMGPAE